MAKFNDDDDNSFVTTNNYEKCTSTGIDEVR